MKFLDKTGLTYLWKLLNRRFVDAESNIEVLIADTGGMLDLMNTQQSEIDNLSSEVSGLNGLQSMVLDHDDILHDQFNGGLADVNYVDDNLAALEKRMLPKAGSGEQAGTISWAVDGPLVLSGAPLKITLSNNIGGGLYDSNMLLDLRTIGTPHSAGMRITAGDRGIGMYAGINGDVRLFGINGLTMTQYGMLPADSDRWEMTTPWAFQKMVDLNGGATIPSGQSLKIGNIPIYYDVARKAIIVEGDLLAIGRISPYETISDETVSK